MESDIESDGSSRLAAELAMSEDEERRVRELVRKVMELVKASGDSGGMTSQDVDRLLYDDRGLPIEPGNDFSLTDVERSG